ncbi:hypothetical protein BC835DRAFT_1306017 [Cytidiella melzeri]|nr:hypothetical protein BC835DRAFT_1306017 [Cytidiella melzeri]
MIILDEEDDQRPKLEPPVPLHVRTNRPSTPTPSLPDYETSQEQLKLNLRNKKFISRRLKWTIWGLGAYFVVTIAIGVPLIIFSRHKGSHKSSTVSWYGVNSSEPILPTVFKLAAYPVDVDDASVCDAWEDVDVYNGSFYSAQSVSLMYHEATNATYAHEDHRLQYSVPISTTVFVQSNMTQYVNNSPHPISGSLHVGTNSEPSYSQATFNVAMSYTSVDIREQTKVCIVKLNISHADGLYIYVPSGLKDSDSLSFDITVDLPHFNGTGSPVYIPNFMTSLPYFSQTMDCPNTEVTFGSVALGGYQQDMHVKAVEAEAVLLRSPFGNTSSIYSAHSNTAKDS